MAPMTSFHAEKCCNLASAHAVSARRICRKKFRGKQTIDCRDVVAWWCCSTAGAVIHRVRGDALPQPDGGLQLCRRRNNSRLRRAEAKRRPQAIHVTLGGVHHRVRVPVVSQDTLAVSDAGGSGGGSNCPPGRRPSRRRYDRGPAASPRSVCNNFVTNKVHGSGLGRLIVYRDIESCTIQNWHKPHKKERKEKKKDSLTNTQSWYFRKYLKYSKYFRGALDWKTRHQIAGVAIFHVGHTIYMVELNTYLNRPINT